MANNLENQQDEILLKGANGGFKVVSAAGEVKEWNKANNKDREMDVNYVSPVQLSDLKKIAQEAYEESGIDLANKTLENRFSNLVISRLREVRNRVEVAEGLKRAVEAGGVGLDNATTDKVVRIIEKKVAEFGNHLESTSKDREELDLEMNKLIKELNVENFVRPKRKRPLAAAITEKISAPVESGLSPIYSPNNDEAKLNQDFNLSEARKEKQAPASRPKVKIEVVPESRPAPASQAVERPKIEKKVSGVSEEKSKIKPSFESEIRGSSSPGKILTEEFNFDDFNAETSPKPAQAEIKTEEPEKEKIKIKTKLTGPVEEIRDLTLIDFRRLDSNPANVAEIIYNKILLLEKDSFAKKAEAISGWRQSEVFKNYMEIGRRSMESKQPIEAVIQEMKEKNEPVLNFSEFEAIMDMNQKLRF